MTNDRPLAIFALIGLLWTIFGMLTSCQKAQNTEIHQRVEITYDVALKLEIFEVVTVLIDTQGDTLYITSQKGVEGIMSANSFIYSQRHETYKISHGAKVIDVKYSHEWRK